MIMKLPKHALSLLLAIPLIISTACGDDDFSGGGGGKKKTDRNDPTKFWVIFSKFEHKDNAIQMTVKVNNPDNLTILKGGYECSCVQDFSDWARSEKDLDENNCADFKLTVSHMKKQYFRPYVTGPTIGRVYGKVWTYDGMSWEITPPSDNDSGTSGEGGGNTPSTSTPDNVNYFNVSVQPIQQLLNSTYMGNNKWRLLVRTFSQVTYSWACDDPDAAGIVVVINNPKNPIDGVKYSGSDASFFNSNGTNVIKQWPRTGGYYNFYVRTYTSNYHYAPQWYTKQVFIEGSKDSYITSNKPGL